MKTPVIVVTIDRLERRTHLSAPFATLTARGTLAVQGTTGADEIHIASMGNQDEAEMNGSRLDFPAASVQRVYVDADAGDDTVDMKIKRRCTIFGGGGNDTLVVG